MRKMPILVGMMVVVMAAATATPLLLRAQAGGAAGARMQGMAQGDDMPHQTARAFAPFLKNIVLRRINTAQQIFKLRRNVETSLGQQETVLILSRFQKPDRLDLNLIGGRMLGKDIGILMFIVATEGGPVGFKIYYYGFEKQIYIARIDITDDWDQIEALSSSVEVLPAPITVSLSGNIDEAGGGQ